MLYKADPNPDPGTEPSEKVDPKRLEKANPTPKFTIWVKDSLMTNLRVVISNMTIAF